MASNGTINRAKKGKCRICQRVRNTDNKVKIVGEVRHGFATGYIWECIDTEECDLFVNKLISSEDISEFKKRSIQTQLTIGRYKEYVLKS